MLGNIHCGITPFALQHLTKAQTAALIDLEEVTTQASNVGTQDILCHNHSAPWHVSPDPHMFLKLLAIFSAITKILFSPQSPLYLNAEALYKITQWGHNGGQLMAL